MTLSRDELKGLLRQYNSRMRPDRLARMLGDSVSPDILTQALNVAMTRIAQTDPVHIFVDGWCRGNGTPEARAGWSVAAILGGRKDSLETGVLPHYERQTNNVAEYYAFIYGLKFGKIYGLPIVIHTDSQLVVKQVTGGWRVKAGHLEPLIAEAQALVAETSAKVVKEPRERIVEILGH